LFYLLATPRVIYDTSAIVKGARSGARNQAERVSFLLYNSTIAESDRIGHVVSFLTRSGRCESVLSNRPRVKTGAKNLTVNK
jgi:hypothetical protein